MTTTTGDPSSLKTPSTLSGGDLVSRLLAATPPYLYNLPMTPHSFYFSEMLRSFVQAKSDTTTSTSTPIPTTTSSSSSSFTTNGITSLSSAASTSPPGPSRRRKRTWRDTRDRPLELTTKEKYHNSNNNNNLHQNHHIQNLNITNDKYFHHDTIDNNKCNNNDCKTQIYDGKINYTTSDVLKQVDDNRNDFTKQSRNFYDDSSRLFGSEQTNQHDLFDNKIKIDDDNTNERKLNDEHLKLNHDILYNEQKTKIDYSTRNYTTTTTIPTIPAIGDHNNINKNFNIGQNIQNPSEFMPNPLWYPPYPIPQSYPGIDPLHFFIDLRVSGHIWDRKLNERQLTFKSKHSSAFSVPQTKEYNNRPLDLTRDESTTSKNDENNHGTHFIMKNLSKTYNDIRDVGRKSPGENEGNSNDAEEVSGSSKKENCDEDENNKGKDLRKLIGLELTNYAREPKEEPRQSPTIIE
ncbi:hypothetical protein HCN44_006041 [Aphidius gifuensis]|uniref:Uncharacterized protein n=1 Tax=Aphidius gifuensis TaxID=684658 RepID=A0A834Y185_APHGI|nr:probable cyclin-dependent serine/threonine-protein kinase DDB_G0292550 [Aphidius gifuensis]XP_044006212.1 probable cyclin-dependent serine/threonine-protein kinase DDB_G0292550 [Aphidius gifuensis]XP_044006220.1 probable cyclin-dependent serine/threonine-protein kinase DDB_G0292550 [Aphidius gifuensis]KAF7997470.1 hypothetical protein HCN44_006041 [Aphidius gifuensis]